MPTISTASHSKPLAEWMVDSTTAFSGGLRSADDCSAILASSSSNDRHDDANATTASTTLVHSARSRSEACPGTAVTTIVADELA